MAERVVSWKAIADFAQVTREAKKSQRALEDLRKKQAQLNAESRRSGVDVTGTENVSKVATDASRASSKAANAANKNATAQQNQVNAMRAAEKASKDMASGMHEAASEASFLSSVAGKVASTSRQIETASTRTTRARTAEAAASRQVAIAEARLNEIRGNSKSTSSQLLAAEDRLLRSQNALRSSLDSTAASTDRAGRGMSGLGRGLSNLEKGFNSNSRGARLLTNALLGFTFLIPLIGNAIGQLLGLISPLTAGVIGLAGAIGPLSGLLATLPGLLLAVGGAAGTLIAGFSGIGGALKAYQKQQDSAAKTAASAAKTAQQNAAKQLQAQRQQESALKRVQAADNAARQAAEENARAIRDAKRGLADAQENAADSAVSSARRIADAERSLRDAQEARAQTLETSQRAVMSAERGVADAQLRALQAQEGITAARVRAQQQIDELRESLKDLALQETGASLSVEEARLRLQRTLNDPASTDLERRGAEQAVKEAEARLGDVRDAAKQNEDALKDAQKKGVEGSDEVVQAKNDEVDAQRDLIDSQRDLADARRDATKAARDSAEAVVDAERSMTEARQDSARAARDSSRAIADAQERLNDSYRDAERRTQDAQDAIEEADQALADLAITTAGSDGAAPAVDEFAEAMKKLTPEARAVVRQLIKMKPLIDAIRKTAQRGLMPGVLSFLISAEKLFPSVNAFVGRAAKSFGDFFARVGKALTTKRGLELWRLALESTNRVIDTFLDAAFNIGVVLGRIVVAGIPLTEWLVDTVKGWTDSWEAMTSGEAGMRRLQGFFKKTREVAELLGSIIGNLSGTLYNLGRGTAELGIWILESFRDMTQGWQDWTGSLEGQNALKKWAEDSKAPLSALSALLGDLFKGLADIARDVDVTPLIEQIRTQLLPALLEFIKVTSDEGFVDVLVRLMTTLLRILTDLAESGVLDAVVSGLESFADALDWVLDNVPGADKLIGGILVALAALRVLRFLGLTSALKGIVDGLKGIGKQARKAKDALDKVQSGAKKAAPGSAVPKSKADPKRSAGAPDPKAPKAPKISIKNFLPEISAGAIAAWAQRNFARIGATIAKEAPKLLSRIGAAVAKEAPKFISKILGPALRGIGTKLFGAGPVGIIVGAILTALGIALPLIVEHWDEISAFLIDATNNIKDWIDENWPKVTGAITDAFEAVEEAVKPIFDGIAEAVRIGSEIVEAIFKTSAGLIYAFIVRPFLFAKTWLEENLPKIGQWIQDRLDEFVLGAQTIWAVIYDNLIQPFIDFFAWIGLKLTEFGVWLADRLDEFVLGAKTIWAAVYDNLIKPFVDFFAWINTKLTEFGTWLGQKFNEFVAGVKFIWNAIKDALIDPVSDALKPVTDKILEIHNAIVRKVEDVLIWLGDRWTEFDSIFLAPIRDLIGSLKKPLDDIHNAIVGAFEGIMAALSRVWGGLAKVINDPIGAAIKPINEFIEGIRTLFGKLKVPKELWPDTIDPPGVSRAPDWTGSGANRGRKGGGMIPGAIDNVHRDTTLGLDHRGVPTARVEPGEWIAPRWMSPIFPSLESIRRRGKGGLKGYAQGGFMTGGTQPAPGPLNRHSSGYGWANWAGDIPAPSGTPVKAYKDGQVSATKYWNYSYGNHIRINHASGEKTLYAHLSSILTNAGARVNEAQMIGRVGTTGNSTGPHLHFELSGGSDPISGDTGANGSANPIGDAIRGLLGLKTPKEWLTEKLDSVIKATDNPFVKMAAGAGKIALDGAEKIAQKFFNANAGDPQAGVAGSFGKGSSGIDGPSGPTTRRMAAILGPMFGVKGSSYPGHSTSSGEGPTRAVDFMINGKSQGDAIAAYAKAHAKSLGVKYIIWWKKIWNIQRDSEGWRNYFDGGSSDPSRAHTNHVHITSAYARGTNSASQGWNLVGENGPEIIYNRGGERIQKNAVARQNLPKFHEGGYVNGIQPGGKGKWVQALRSQLGLGSSSTWSTTLQKALQAKDPQPVGAFKLNTAFMKKVADTLKKYSKYGFWDVAKKLKVDPSYLWRHGSDKGLWGAFKKYKVPANRATHFRNGWRDYSNARHAGVKDLEKKLGLKQDGIWGSEITAPLAHALDHMFKRPHDALASRPWSAFTPTELALQEQRRTNSLNAEWDKLLKGFSGLPNITRKLNELGIADGLALARDLTKSTASLRNEYERNLKVEYDRADAQDPNTQAGKINLFIQAIGSGTPAVPVGLQGASSAAGVSIDTGAMLYDKINAEKLWGAVSTTQRKRVDGDVARFRKLFRFRNGGPVPGYGNGDRVHLLGEPGEFMMRKNAVSALTRDYGPGVMGALNHYEKMANGGFVAGGVSRPGAGVGGISISRGETSETSSKTVTNNFNTVVNNPTLEDGAVSVQKRVTRLARLGLLSGDPR